MAAMAMDRSTIRYESARPGDRELRDRVIWLAFNHQTHSYGKALLQPS